MLERDDFLNKLIDNAIKELYHDFIMMEDSPKFKGNLKALEDCRGKQDREILDLYKNSSIDVTIFHKKNLTLL